MKDRQDAARQYKQMRVQTSSPGKLILMLFDGALRFLGEAGSALRAGQMEAAHAALLKAQNVVAELAGSLNPEAGELATNLGQLYAYMHGRLVEANVQKDAAPIQEVEDLLRQLRDAWAEMLAAKNDSAADRQGTGNSEFRAVMG